MFFFFDRQLEADANHPNRAIEETTFSKMTSQHGSFGKASISSAFSVKSGTSDRDSQIDTLLKTIAKDTASSIHAQESLNDATSIRVTINKNTDYENNNDTLKKLTTNEKPNNQMKLMNVGATLPPLQMKCNILKGMTIVRLSPVEFNDFCIVLYVFLARAEEEAHHPTKVTNQLYGSSMGNSDSGPDSLNAATIVSVVSYVKKTKLMFWLLSLFDSHNVFIWSLCYSHL